MGRSASGMRHYRFRDNRPRQAGTESVAAGAADAAGAGGAASRAGDGAPGRHAGAGAARSVRRPVDAPDRLQPGGAGPSAGEPRRGPRDDHAAHDDPPGHRRRRGLDATDPAARRGEHVRPHALRQGIGWRRPGRGDRARARAAGRLTDDDRGPGHAAWRSAGRIARPGRWATSIRFHVPLVQIPPARPLGSPRPADRGADRRVGRRAAGDRRLG